MKNQTLAVLSAFFLVIGSCPALFADDVDPREMAVDLAVGGMAEGSRPLASGSGGEKIPGAGLSPGMDTRVTASAAGRGISASGSAPGTGAPGGDSGTTVGANLDDTTGTEDRSIIEADATLDTTGGTPAVDADVSLDTSAKDGLVDADATTTADIVDQELTSDAGVQIDMGDSTTLLEASLGNEIGTSTAPPDAEADAGLEADVEGTGSGDDVAADPADGLSSGSLL